jgi:hypothetical protein
MRSKLIIVTMMWSFVVSTVAAAAPELPVYPPDGTYIYRWNRGNVLAGQSTIVVRTRGTTVSMQAETNLTGLVLAGGTLALRGPQLSFVSYKGFASSNGLDTQIDLGVLGGSVSGTTSSQSVTNPVNASLYGVPTVAIDDGALGTYLMLPAQLNARTARNFQLIPIATGIAGTTPLSISQVGPYPSGVPTTDTVVLLGQNTMLWYDPTTFVVDQFTRGNLAATLVSSP